MDSNTITLIIGLAGIAGTALASGFGLYFTSKARNAPLRELLYQKQLDLITQIIHKQERFRIYATILFGEDPEFKARAEEDIRICMKEYSELIEQATTLLPINLLAEIKILHNYMIKNLIAYDEKTKIENDFFSKLVEIETKVSVISRVVLGVDKLTKESLKLFSSTKLYDTALKMEFDNTGHVLIGKREISHTINENQGK